ncbi:MAG: SPFH/Band 7/PHB domain protein [Chloroflexi bacterium]|mgnify:CR=1 FL=1|jgi:regulator of protease activity HflC (stomatin/prohibitin superfamily)|nr:SPFH/Band 7/PHB domain protein [Chloroflexota bacterium]
MSDIFITLFIAVVSFFVFLIGEPVVRWLLRVFGVYAIVEEGTCHVYVLFGKVVSVLKEPGLHLLWLKLGPRALIINLLGERHILDMRLDQQYLRSLPVNSEEGAPMGIGVWYEMQISDPVAYLFKNTDPRGSLSANVSSATVRMLSNMPLDDMLVTRHVMSRAVREEVSPKSEQWGYRLGSVYVRKVHFRDSGMIRQIEEKVVNRLRQVTSAILQDGANRVSIITSSAERRAAVEFARAQAMRPQIVGAALQQIGEDPEVAKAMFAILETQNLVNGEARITFLPNGDGVLADLLAAAPAPVARRAA